ncbi:hypothetical protein NL676_021199 [Syzygium grande]|nr:hypothetical protein NL676_021199 [Syzygium grande]
MRKGVTGLTVWDAWFKMGLGAQPTGSDQCRGKQHAASSRTHGAPVEGVIVMVQQKEDCRLGSVAGSVAGNSHVVVEAGKNGNAI